MKYLNNLILLTFVAMLTVGCNYQVVPVPTAPPKPAEVTKPEPTVKTRFSGDYEVLRLRAMWAVCAQSYAQKVPTAGPNMIAGICDCYVDKIRENFSQAKLLKITQPEAVQMGMKYIGECNAEFMDRLGRQQGSGTGSGTNFELELPKSKYDI